MHTAVGDWPMGTGVLLGGIRLFFSLEKEGHRYPEVMNLKIWLFELRCRAIFQSLQYHVAGLIDCGRLRRAGGGR